MVAVFLLGAIAGLAGGLVAQKNGANADSSDTGTESDTRATPGPHSSHSATTTSTSAPASSSTPLASQLLDNSQLAAQQWGNSAGTVSYVAYQDPISSPMFAAWDSSNATWRSVRILVLFINEENIVRGVDAEQGENYLPSKPPALYDDSRIPAHPQSPLSAFWLWYDVFFDTGETLGMVARINVSGWGSDKAVTGAIHPTFPGQ
ncbi:hypothetical protein C8A01DRAFT_36764 [Parachaetomium inaequale]|uniref:Uncharacterized protein n=1 Tax=Parachaetomium inaequale TaxID=2588326 RepID=A0AAN6SRB4_9PEZI|nr:hypothetical protein C8A01DRAFT_36764 [Parachaetomium inaequale]